MSAGSPDLIGTVNAFITSLPACSDTCILYAFNATSLALTSIDQIFALCGTGSVASFNKCVMASCATTGDQQTAIAAGSLLMQNCASSSNTSSASRISALNTAGANEPSTVIDHAKPSVLSTVNSFLAALPACSDPCMFAAFNTTSLVLTSFSQIIAVCGTDNFVSGDSKFNACVLSSCSQNSDRSSAIGAGSLLLESCAGLKNSTESSIDLSVATSTIPISTVDKISENSFYSSNNTGIILGSIFGSIGVIAIVGLIVGGIYFNRRKGNPPKPDQELQTDTVQTYINPIEDPHQPPPEYEFLINQQQMPLFFPQQTPASDSATDVAETNAIVSSDSLTPKQQEPIEKHSLMNVYRNPSSPEQPLNPTTSAIEEKLALARCELLQSNLGQDPLQWNVQEVSRWVCEKGGNNPETQNAIKFQEMNGRMLLGLLSEKDVSNILKVEEEIACIRIWNGIRELKVLVELGNESGVS